jgi:chromate reductase
MAPPPAVESTARPFEVLGLPGSLRKGSYNRSLLHAAIELAPSDLRITIHEVGSLPFYDADLETGVAPPPAVSEIRDALRRSDALLVATPEYNYGVPGLLKNAIDWLSRPARGSALDGKVAAIMGAATGMVGTARGQLQLRQTFVFTNTYVLPQPEILVPRAAEKFDSEGHLTDPATRDLLATFLRRFADFIARFTAR